jgi:hypothetical protein
MLTDVLLRKLRPRERPYKKTDERGMYVIVNPDGSRWFRLKYRFEGREKSISLTTRARGAQQGTRRS